MGCEKKRGVKENFKIFGLSIRRMELLLNEMGMFVGKINLGGGGEVVLNMMSLILDIK